LYDGEGGEGGDFTASKVIDIIVLTNHKLRLYALMWRALKKCGAKCSEEGHSTPYFTSIA
jgi:hypothetical protein